MVLANRAKCTFRTISPASGSFSIKVEDEGTYINKDGKEEYNNAFTIAGFDSLGDFANSEHNTFKDDYDDVDFGYKPFDGSHRDTKGNILQRYEKAVMFVTSKFQDSKMKKTAKETTATDYNTILNNCIDNVESTLKVGGFKTGNGNGMDPPEKFDDIKSQNKGAYDISVFLKPIKNEKQKN